MATEREPKKNVAAAPRSKRPLLGKDEIGKRASGVVSRGTLLKNELRTPGAKKAFELTTVPAASKKRPLAEAEMP
ncbi:MAG: hypothetical protein HY812_15255 [Planctomycetes bacterium]|nr:hypothetical protein [Planctomycetota bacterium]